MGQESNFAEVHFESVAWVLSRLNEDERSEFVEGFRSIDARLHSVMDGSITDQDETRALLRELYVYIRSWVVSVKLAADKEWRDQVEATEREVEGGLDADVELLD